MFNVSAEMQHGVNAEGPKDCMRPSIDLDSVSRVLDGLFSNGYIVMSLRIAFYSTVCVELRVILIEDIRISWRTV